MSLVTAKEIAKVINLDKYGFIGTFFGWLLMKILRITNWAIILFFIGG